MGCLGSGGIDIIILSKGNKMTLTQILARKYIESGLSTKEEYMKFVDEGRSRRSLSSK